MSFIEFILIAIAIILSIYFVTNFFVSLKKNKESLLKKFFKLIVKIFDAIVGIG